MGKPCNAVAVDGGLCAFTPDPKRAAQLGRMGGSKNRRHYPLGSETEPLHLPQTAKEVKDLLAEAMAGLHAGRLEPRIGSVIAYLGTALLKAIETTDHQERPRSWHPDRIMILPWSMKEKNRKGMLIERRWPQL